MDETKVDERVTNINCNELLHISIEHPAPGNLLDAHRNHVAAEAAKERMKKQKEVAN